jgi:hypothetical protein
MEEMGLLNLSLSSEVGQNVMTEENLEKKPSNSRREKKRGESSSSVDKVREPSTRFLPPKPFETVDEKRRKQEISADRMGDQFLSSRR